VKPPKLRIRVWTWDRGTPREIPGIGLYGPGGQVIAHLSYQQAREAADRIHDFCDKAEAARQENTP
jgi:hypothetical protein